MIICSNCGAQNEPNAVFCKSCSYFLEWSTETSASPAAAQQPEAHPSPRATPEASPPPSTRPAPSAASDRHAAAAALVEPTGGLRPTGPARDPVAVALDEIAEGRRLALASGRDDLAAHLHRTAVNLSERRISVAVVGEFKRGKSTLVNALLQTAVCPVDADIVTAVPTVVRFGEQASALAYPRGTDGASGSDPEPVSVDELDNYISELGNPGNRRRLAAVEVLLPHPILRSGLSVVDTPGVGGLDSAHGVAALNALTRADGMLFVTDASQELTDAELTFLSAALERCPNAACVVTKTDLHMSWRRIVELDETHLHNAGLDLPVLPVSSLLRLASITEPDLLGESGFPALVDFVLGTIVAAGVARTVQAARAEIEFVTAQLEDGLRAERAVLEQPAQAPQVIEQLTEATERSRRLVSPTATWQQMLNDGIQDLVADVEFDLQERLRAVVREVEAIIDEGDPRQTWADIEIWLRRRAADAVVANYDRMNQLADLLAADVAASFNLAAGTVSSAAEAAVTNAVSRVPIATAANLEAPGGRLATMVIAGRTAMLLPMMLVSVLGPVMMVVVAPLAAALAGGIGQKIIRDERRRQVAYRRQQAKAAARRYIDDVAFLVSKDARDALRATQRALRDDFAARAASLQRSSEAVVETVQNAAALSAAERRDRLAAVTARTVSVANLRGAARPMAAVGS